MKQTLTEILLQALTRAKEKGELKLETQPAITLDTPREKSHGDLATTLAMTLAKPESKPPRKIAEIIVSEYSGRGRRHSKRPRSPVRGSSILPSSRTAGRRRSLT